MTDFKASEKIKEGKQKRAEKRAFNKTPQGLEDFKKTNRQRLTEGKSEKVMSEQGKTYSGIGKNTRKNIDDKLHKASTVGKKAKSSIGDAFKKVIPRIKR